MPESPENTAAALAAEFVKIGREQLAQRSERIESCLERLSEEGIWTRRHEIENAVGNLVLHLCGNVRQWIVSGVGRAPDDRDRDAEFARRDPMPKEQLRARLRAVLAEADDVLAKLEPHQLLETRFIQAYDVTVMHAVAHVFTHFAEHTGQIIWATKRQTGEDLGFYRHLQSAGSGLPPEGP